jgi:hypothetical protein
LDSGEEWYDLKSSFLIDYCENIVLFDLIEDLSGEVFSLSIKGEKYAGLFDFSIGVNVNGAGLFFQGLDSNLNFDYVSTFWEVASFWGDVGTT